MCREPLPPDHSRSRSGRLPAAGSSPLLRFQLVRRTAFMRVRWPRAMGLEPGQHVGVDSQMD
jgi:hypothetical protein